MGQSSTSLSDVFASENAGAATPENADRPNRVPREDNAQPPGERLRALSEELSAADRNPAAQGQTGGAQQLEQQLATRELLLDELVDQLGAWEKEIARRRDELERCERRLDARQADLDRRDKELAEARERLQAKQIETERSLAAAESQLAAFSRWEETIHSRDRAPRTSGPFDTSSPNETERVAAEAGDQADNSSCRTTTIAATPDAPSTLAPLPADNEENPASAPVVEPSAMTATPAPAPVPEHGSEADLTADMATGGLATARFWNQFSGNRDADSACATPVEATPRQSAPEEAGATSISDPVPNTTTEPVTRAEEESESEIQDYMQALLGRGDKSPPPRPEPAVCAPCRAPVRPEPPIPAGRSPKPSPVPPVLRPRPARKPVPKVDLTAQMPALRDMANESARSALHYYSRQRIADWLKWAVVAVLATLVISMSIFWFSRPLALLAVGAAVIAACGALLMVSKHATSRGGQAVSRAAGSDSEDNAIDDDSDSAGATVGPANRVSWHG